MAEPNQDQNTQDMLSLLDEKGSTPVKTEKTAPGSAESDMLQRLDQDEAESGAVSNETDRGTPDSAWGFLKNQITKFVRPFEKAGRVEERVRESVENKALTTLPKSTVQSALQAAEGMDVEREKAAEYAGKVGALPAMAKAAIEHPHPFVAESPMPDLTTIPHPDHLDAIKKNAAMAGTLQKEAQEEKDPVRRQKLLELSQSYYDSVKHTIHPDNDSLAQEMAVRQGKAFPRKPLTTWDALHRQAEKDSPYLLGIGEGLTELSGRIAGDPQNWPFLLMPWAKLGPVVNKLMSLYFAGQMGAGTIDLAGQVGSEWDNSDAYHRAKMITELISQGLLTSAVGRHVVSPEMGVNATEGFLKEINNEVKQPFGVETKEVAGEKVPVREKGTAATLAYKAAEPEAAAQKVLEKRTVPAIQKGISRVAGEVLGSEKEFAPKTGDFFSLHDKVEELEGRAQTAFKLVDEVSSGDLTKFQDEANAARRAKDWQAFNAAIEKQDALFETAKTLIPADQMTEADLDAARADWRKAQATKEFASRLGTATEASQTYEGGYTIKTGKSLANQINSMVRNFQEPKNVLRRMGWDVDHIHQLEEFGRVMREESVFPRFSRLNRLVGRYLAMAGLAAIGVAEGGGWVGRTLSIAGGIAIEQGIERVGARIGRFALQRAMETPEALTLMNEGLKGGDIDHTAQSVATTLAKDPGWLSKVWDVVKGTKGEMVVPGTGKGGVKEITPEDERFITGNTDELKEKFGWTDEDITAMREAVGREARPETKVETEERPVGVGASGESAASLEAINRQAGEESEGTQYFRVLQNGKEVPLIGPERVDMTAGPGETIVRRTPGQPETELDRGQGSTYRGPSVNEPPKEVIPVNKTVLGSAVNEPKGTYHDAVSQTTGNPWVRRSADAARSAAPTNEGRQLLVQISSDLINKLGLKEGAEDRLASDYYDKLYSGTREGYARLQDFWEIPQWVGRASQMLPDADFYVVRDVPEAVKFLNEAKYDRVAFSALDVNKDFIRQIADGYKGKIDVGGYVDRNTFFDKPNVTWHDKIEDLAKSLGLAAKEGVDYRHFEGSDVIPRLTMSDGCLHKCAFCVIPKEIKQQTPEAISQQADAIAKLGSKLVYVSDKTFGQAANYESLVDLNNQIKEQNPDFKGFVVQTTAAQLNKLPVDFLKKSGIKFVELGIESYNDPLLKEMHKPATEKLIDKAVDKLRQNKIALIPNILIGYPGETAETYDHTLDFLKRNSDVISHANIYNLALYKDTELGKKMTTASEGDFNENVLEKSWFNGSDIHQTFAGDLYGMAQEMLEKQPFERVGEPRDEWLRRQRGATTPDFLMWLMGGAISEGAKKIIETVRGKGEVGEVPGFPEISPYLTVEDRNRVGKSLATRIMGYVKELGDPALIEEAAKAGSIQKGWYRRTGDLIRGIFGEDAKQFIDFFAMLSPQKKVPINFREAIQFYGDWVDAGKPRGPENVKKILNLVDKADVSGPSASVSRAQLKNNLIHGEAPSGPKISSFANNLMGEMDTVTKDTLYGYLFGLPKGMIGKENKGQPQRPRPLAVDAVTRRIAERLSMEPAEVQETGWSFIRTALAMAESNKMTPREIVAGMTNEDIRGGSSEFTRLITENAAIRDALNELADRTGNESFRVSNIEQSPLYRKLRAETQTRGEQELGGANPEILTRTVKRATKAAGIKTPERPQGSLSFNPVELEAPKKAKEGKITKGLLSRYGTTDKTTGPQYLLSDGRRIPVQDHDLSVAQVLGKGYQYAPEDRIDYINNENVVRIRPRTGRGGNEVVFSIPDRVTPAQIVEMQKTAATVGAFGTVYVEQARHGGRYATRVNAQPSMIPDMVHEVTGK